MRIVGDDTVVIEERGATKTVAPTPRRPLTPAKPHGKSGKKKRSSLPLLPPHASDIPPLSPPIASPRLVSLDAFRGLTVALMLLVNNATLDSAVPAQMVHASFGALPTLADMVFPWFLLVVGVAVPFAAGSKKEQGMHFLLRAWLVLRRTLGLYAAGCLVDSSIYHQPTWGLGVLQLIALAYLIGRALYGLPTALRALTAAGLLLFYGWALTGLQWAGFSPGPFAEGHNLAQHLNDHYLASLNLDGLSSIIPTGALVLVGTFVGDIFRGKNITPGGRLLRLLLLAGTLGATGRFWADYLLMNKQFWTPSYICWSAGAGIVLLTGLYLIVDVLGQKKGFGFLLRGAAWPLVVFGANALVAYAGAILVKIHLLQEWNLPVGKKQMSIQDLLQQLLFTNYGRVPGGWLYMLGYLFFVWLFCAYLYRKRIFIRA